MRALCLSLVLLGLVDSAALAPLAIAAAAFPGHAGLRVGLGVVALAVSIYNYPRRSAWQQVVDYYAGSNAAAGQNSLGL